MVVRHRGKIAAEADRLGDIESISVTEEATPLVVGDSSGAVPQLSVNARAKRTGPIHKRSGAAVADEFGLVSTFTLPDGEPQGEGQVSGRVRDVSLPGERAALTIDSIMSQLNTDRRAEAHFGTPRPDQTTVTVRTNLHTNPSRDVNLSTLSALSGPGGVVALSRETDGGYAGDNYSRVTWTTAATAEGGGIRTSLPAAPNKSYSMIEFYRVSRAAGALEGAVVQGMIPQVNFLNNATVVRTVSGTPIRMVNNQWTQVEYPVVTAPSNTTAVEFSLVADSAVAGFSRWLVGDQLDSDAAIVQNGRIDGNVFDGNTVVAANKLASNSPVSVEYAYAWKGAVGASVSTETITTTYRGQDYTATEATAFRYYCGLVGITNTYVEPIFEQRIVAYKSWEGNVWNYLKQFCAAIGAEIALVNDTVTLRVPRQRQVSIESVKNFVPKVTTASSSQFVEVINYDTHWASDEVFYRSETPIQVPSNGFAEVIADFPHDIYSVNQPVAVDAFEEGYVIGRGQYLVIDSQGLIVKPTWWNSRGGRVIVERINESSNTVRIVARGCADGNGYVGPFQIASIGNNGDKIGGLDVTGEGVFENSRNVRARTGITADITSNEVDSVIDNIFITNKFVAMDRAVGAACRAAGPVVTITGTLSYYDFSQSYGMLIGSRLIINDNVFRITSVEYNTHTISFEGEADMTFGDLVSLYAYPFAYFDSIYAGLTFGDFNAAQDGKTFGDFAESFGSTTFETFNDVFAGASFADHTVYPYIKDVINEEPTRI